MAATDPAGGTPTAPAIAETRRQLETSPHPRRAIVLATDGAPNCNPDLTTPGCICTVAPMLCEATGGGAACLDELRTAAVIGETHEAFGIPVYVVGIDDPLDPTLAGVLDRLAVAGGRPRTTGPRRFYSALSSRELDEALALVTSRIALCGFTLASIPANEEALVVSLDGVPLADRDWTWIDREHGEIEILGDGCDQVRLGAHVDATVLACD
jgi:hypothetical protein